MSETLEDIFGKKRPRGRGCPACGGKNVAQVVVQLRELDETGHTGRKGTRSASSFVSLCAEHAVELRQRLLNVFGEYV